VNVYAEFLKCLEHARSIDARVISAELRGCASPFAARRWIVPDGYQTSILAPVLNCEEEVDVVVDQERGIFRYRSPAQPSRVLTRSLDEIAIYAFNVDTWLDAIVDAFEFENAHRARRRIVIDGHLWHLGNLRVGRTHHFAPIYVARRLTQCADDWRKRLIDALRPSHGIVLTAGEVDVDWPNGHRRCGIDDLLIASGDGIACDIEVLNRMLRGTPADGDELNDRFDERTGELKLHHMTAPKVFSGEKQKAVVAAFWRGRHESSIKWSDVVARTGCGRDPDSVFGKKVWREWLESRGHGLYRLRVREQHRS
jgi:hypothetical protein